MICDFQTSTYTITISTRGLPDVTRQSTYSGGSRDIEETFDSQLQPNKNYTITVSIEDERFEGQVSTSMTISKLLTLTAGFYKLNLQILNVIVTPNSRPPPPCVCNIYTNIKYMHGEGWDPGNKQPNMNTHRGLR